MDYFVYITKARYFFLSSSTASTLPSFSSLQAKAPHPLLSFCLAAIFLACQLASHLFLSHFPIWSILTLKSHCSNERRLSFQFVHRGHKKIKRLHKVTDKKDCDLIPVQECQYRSVPQVIYSSNLSRNKGVLQKVQKYKNYPEEN